MVERREQAQARVLDRIANGVSVRGAARLAGVASRTVWCQEDPAFAQRMADARQDGLDAIEMLIVKHVATDWRAGIAYLAAHRPEKWGRKARVQIEDGPNRRADAAGDRKHVLALLQRLGIDAAALIDRDPTERPVPQLPGLGK